MQDNGDKIIKKINYAKITAYILLAVIIIGIASIPIIILDAISDVPDYNNLKDFKNAITTRVYSADGVLLKEYSLQNRVYIPLNEIPQGLIDAFLSAEDIHFFKHNGIDFHGIIRAGIANIKSHITKDGNLQGASTITQQLVKNALLTNERTFKRKIKEIYLSIEISRHFSKEDILEMYLNYIYLGSGAYGVQAASVEYFGKHLNELSTSEFAMLASLPKAPSELNPRTHYDAAKIRRNWVLRQLQINGFITKSAMLAFASEDIKYINHIKKHSNIEGVNNISDYIKTKLMTHNHMSDFFTAGYTVYTTIDSRVQKALYTSFRNGIDLYTKRSGGKCNASLFIPFDDNWCKNLQKKLSNVEHYNTVEYTVLTDVSDNVITLGLENCHTAKIEDQIFIKSIIPSQYKVGSIVPIQRYGDAITIAQMADVNGAAMVMDIKTGRVLAMVGDYFDQENGFNRAMQAKRQPGSAIKPFVYMAALANGFTPSSIVVDEEISLGDDWSPENANDSYLGAITLRKALEYSRNVPTVRIADILGPQIIASYLAKFDLLGGGDALDLSSVLGTTNVTLEKMAKAYGAIANGGTKIESSMIDHIQNSSGRTIYTDESISCMNCKSQKQTPTVAPKMGERIISEDLAFQVKSLLEGAVLRGTGAAARGLGIGIGGKTGTTSGPKDTWFVGITNDIVVAIYVGYDIPRNLGNEYGTTIPLPIFISAMKDILKVYPSSAFTPPQGIKILTVDYTTGIPLENHQSGGISEFFKEMDVIPQPQTQSSSFDII